MIVVDASAAISSLFSEGPARRTLSADRLHAPHLIDPEIANGIRRRVSVGRISSDAGWRALDTWRRLGMTRHPTISLLERIWQLRDNLSAYDASYVALAEALGCSLLTADRRLSMAPGIECAVTVVPR